MSNDLLRLYIRVRKLAAEGRINEHERLVLTQFLNGMEDNSTRLDIRRCDYQLPGYLRRML